MFKGMFNAFDRTGFEPYHVGINNIKRRIALLYQNDYQIAFFNVSEGACCLICLPARLDSERNDP